MSEPDPAAARFAIIQLTRVAAMLVVVAGAIILSERWINSPVAGTVLLVGGALAFYLIPLFLAKRWKSTDE